MITDQAKGRLHTLSHSHRGPETNDKLHNLKFLVFKKSKVKKTGTCLLKAPNISLYYFVSIKSLLSTTLLNIIFKC